MGILDGRNLENRSVPLLKLEVDVATLAQLQQEIADRIADVNAEELARIDADEALQDNIDAANAALATHAGTGIATAHPGQLNIENQVPDGSIGIHKLSFTPALQSDFSNHINDGSIHFQLANTPTGLGTHFQAANGDHYHPSGSGSGLDADTVDGFHHGAFVHMTGDETVQGVKTFTNDMILNANLTVNGTTTTIDTQNLLVEDNEVVVNKNEAAAGVTAGHAGVRVERGTEPDFLMRFDESDDKFKVGIEGINVTAVSLEGHTHSGTSLVIPKGVSAFAGSGSYQTVNFSPAAADTSYEVVVTPNADTGGNLGDMWYTKVSNSQFRVYNTGSAVTGFFYTVMI